MWIARWIIEFSKVYGVMKIYIPRLSISYDRVQGATREGPRTPPTIFVQRTGYALAACTQFPWVLSSRVRTRTFTIFQHLLSTKFARASRGSTLQSIVKALRWISIKFQFWTAANSPLVCTSSPTDASNHSAVKSSCRQFRSIFNPWPYH